MSAITGRFAPDVYFPTEITAREYAGHLLLATRLAGEGINSVIGQKGPVKSLMSSASAAGVIFYKSSARDEASGTAVPRCGRFRSGRPGPRDWLALQKLW